MFSKNLRLTAASSILLLTNFSHASTWVPIGMSDGIIFVPSPSLDSATSNPINYGTSATLTLNGFGATSSIYYRVKQFQGGSWQVPATWSCKDNATLTASNQLLQLQNLAFGHYQVDVKPVMVAEQCDLNAFAAEQLIAGDMVSSNEFDLFNTSPIANSDTISTAEDTAVIVDVLANDTDVDNQTLSVTTASANNGSVSINADQTLTYTPNADFNGSDTINYTLIDGFGGTANSTVAVTVVAINDAPVAIAQSVSLSEDSALAVTLSATDKESSSLVYSITSGPANGVLSGSGANQTYTPFPNFNGTDSFTFRAYDNTSYSNIATVNITVNSLNDIPVAHALYSDTNEDIPIPISFVGTDADGDNLTYTITSNPHHGTITGTGATRMYQPDHNYFGIDIFLYTANDGTADSAATSVSITINSVNDTPVAERGQVHAYEDNPQIVYLRATDVEGNALSYRIVTQPSHGTLSGSGQNYIYTPHLNYTNNSNSVDSFTYVVNDGAVDSAIETVDVHVEPLNDRPVAIGPDITTTKNTPLSITLTGSDLENDTLTYSVTSSTSHGALVGSGNTYIYTPSHNFNGTDSFVFTVDDGGTVEGDAGEFPDVSTSHPATVNIIVTNTNAAPTVSAPSPITINEDTSEHTISFTGLDDDDDVLTYSIVTPPINGTLTGAGNSRFYTPNANFNGVDFFTFKANDGTVDSAAFRVDISITAINDVPVGDTIQVATREDTNTTITLSGTDIESTGLIYAIATNPTNGTLSGSGQHVTYTPNDNFYGNDSFTFTVSDGVLVSAPATVSIIVVGQNDAPVVLGDTLITKEDVAIDITFTGSDQENGALTYPILTNPTNGVLTGSGANRTYTPHLNFNGNDSFSFKANDGTSDSEPATINLRIDPVNDQPLAITGSSTISEDSAGIDILLLGTDVDNDPLTYIVVNNPTKGTLSGSGSTRHYVPNPNENGTDTIGFKVNDGTIDSAVENYTINISAVNDLPTGTTQDFTIIEDSAALTINLTGNDLDGDALTYTIVTPPTKGSLSGSGETRSYTPNTNIFGSDSFSYKIYDGIGYSSAIAVNIMITTVNDVPVAVNDTAQVDEDGTVSIDVLTNDSDFDGDTLTIESALANHGVVDINSANQLVYTPAVDFNGVDVIAYTINDGNGATDSATVTITISPVNDAPTGSVSINGRNEKNQPLDLTHTVMDVDGLGPLSYQWYRGNIAISGATATVYTLTASEIGQTVKVSLCYTDGSGTAECVTSPPTAAVTDEYIPTRQIRFIHTDLLGTPVAETDENGNVL